MISLSKDLESRINPEKSRNFSSVYFLEHLLILEEIYKEILKKFPINPIKISIVGTNGKGSTGYFLTQLFYYYGFDCGYYSSPHLLSYTERILVNLTYYNENLLNNYYNDFIKEIVNKNNKLTEYYKNLTYFEVLTIFTIYLFYRLNLKIHIYEAGLGGRFDATKIVNPDFVILTNVSLDHTKVLGNTIEKILNEKLGIISKNTQILFVGDPKLETYIKKQRLSTKIHYFQLQDQFSNYLEYNKQFSLFCFNKMMEFLKFNLPKKQVVLKNPPGRLEIKNVGDQLIIFDVSHNTKGIYTFLNSLRKEFSDINKDNTILILGLLKDRSYKNIERLFSWTNLSLHYPFPYIPVKEEFIHNESVQKLSFIELKDLKKLVNHKKYIIICGSFRLYELYLNLIEQSGENYE